MNILVAIASTYGSTRELGGWVAAERRGAGHTVRVEDVGAAGSLQAYDGVVLGSAVYIGRILTQARQFARRLEMEFAPKPVWVFAAGMKNVTTYPLGIRYTSPVHPPYFSGQYPIFGGEVDRDRLGPAERALVGFVGAQHRSQRNRQIVAAWAGEVAARMHAWDTQRETGS